MPDRHAAGHARAHGHDQRRLQDVQRHRLADRLDHRAGRPDRRDPEGARLPHRGRARAAAGGSRGGARRAATATFYDGLTAMYRGKRDLLHAALVDAGLPLPPRPRARTTSWPTSPDWPRPDAALDDTAFAVWLSREVGVTPVPGSSFYREGGGRSLVRFVFCKTEEILVEAARRLPRLARTATGGGRGARGLRSRRSRAACSADGARGTALVTGATAGHRPRVLPPARRAGPRPRPRGARRRPAGARWPTSCGRDAACRRTCSPPT